MEGLRKGSLFPFLRKQGRGERSVLPLPRASGGQPAGQGYLLLVAVPTCRASGFRGACPCSRGESWRLPDRSPLAYFACFPVADGLSAPARRTLRRAGKPATGAGHAAHPLSGCGRIRFAPRGRRAGVCAPSHAGRDAPADRPRYGPGRLGKSGFSGREQKSIAFCSGLGYGFSIVCGKWRHGAANPSRNQP